MTEGWDFGLKLRVAAEAAAVAAAVAVAGGAVGRCYRKSRVVGVAENKA